jgi:hypothetical protein
MHTLVRDSIRRESFGFKRASLPHFWSLLEVTVEALEARELEHRVVGLLLELGAPVPRGRQPPVYARPGVEEVIRSTSVETVPEEIGQNAWFGGDCANLTSTRPFTCFDVFTAGAATSKGCVGKVID